MLLGATSGAGFAQVTDQPPLVQSQPSVQRQSRLAAEPRTSSDPFAVQAAAPVEATAEQRRMGPALLEAAIETRVVYTNNPGPDDRTGLTHRDTLVEVRPSVVFERRGSLASINGNLAVSAIDYLDHSHGGRLLPRGRVNLASQPLEGWVYFDAFARVDPTTQNPSLARPGDDLYYTLEPRTQYSLSPYVLRRFGDAGTLTARTDFTSTRITDPANPANKFNATALDNAVRYERQPRPFGFTLEGRTHNEDDDRIGRTLETTNSRLWVDYALDPQFVVGVGGGQEDVSVLASALSDRVFGARFQWRPTERTNLNLSVEDRYFGRGWDASFSHRSPFMSFSLNSNRTVTGQDTPQFSFSPGQNIRNAIDESFRTQYGNDAVARNAAVTQYLDARGLKDFAPSALTLYSVVPQIRQNIFANLTLIGRRNTIFAQFGVLKAQAIPAFTTLLSNDLRETSSSVGWNTRVSQVTTFNLTFDTLRVEYLSGVNQGGHIQQRTIRGETVLNLSPKSALTFGARRLHASASSLALLGNQMPNEKAVYVGLRHRF